MSKQNAFLLKMQQAAKDEARAAQYVNERQALDALILAVHDEFGFGKDRIDRLIDRYIEKRVKIAEAAVADRYGNKDKDLSYFKADTDRALRQVMGETYPEHDARYTVDLRRSMYEGGIRVK